MMKMKAIFLNGSPANYDRVYDEETQALLKEKFDFSKTLHQGRPYPWNGYGGHFLYLGHAGFYRRGN